MFLAPDVNFELLNMFQNLNKNAIIDDRGWTAHATILINNEDEVMKAIPIASKCFEGIEGRITGLSLYEFFPTRHIADYRLK